MSWIDYSYFPHAGGISNLFVDYISDFKKVQHFFEWDFHPIDNFNLRTDKIQVEYKNRNDIYNILLRQNRDFDCPQSTFVNLNKLQDENTFAIVTGQQVGILGGPLYTIYKIITLIKLTNFLNSHFSDKNFVPIFWLEGEDHDFSEVNNIKVINHENKIETVFYESKAKISKHGAVGDYRFDENIIDFYHRLISALPTTEFKQDIRNYVESICTINTTFEKSFVKFINTLFPESGIIFITSNDRDIKNILSPIFQKEFNQYPLTSHLVIQKSAELEENYHAQIKPRAFNLFMFHKGARYLIEPRENDFSLKGTRKFLSKEEMLQIAVESPELLSPNVVLRPICQDVLLPTAAYIAGPSEIAYFAQLKSVYNEFGMSMPIIYPRASVTFLEDKIARILEKYELSIAEIFEGANKISSRVIDIVSEVKIEELFDESRKHLNDVLNEMKFGLGYIDQTLLGALETTRSKIEYQLNSLKERTNEAQKRKHEIALKQVEKALNNLFPNENYQERELNILNYMNKYGLEFHKWLMGEIQIDKFMHQVIDIK